MSINLYNSRNKELINKQGVNEIESIKLVLACAAI